MNEGTLSQLEKRVKRWDVRNKGESGCIIVSDTAQHEALCDISLDSGAPEFSRIPALSLKVSGTANGNACVETTLSSQLARAGH